jgi:hypothetical protein
VVTICTFSGYYIYRTVVNIPPVVTIYTASGYYIYRTVVTIYTVSGHYMYRQWSLYVPPVVTIFTASGHYMYRQWLLYVPPVSHSTTLRSAHTLYLGVLCGSQNKQPLFPYTTLTDWFV